VLAEGTSLHAIRLRALFGGRRVDPEFHPDVGELLGIGEAAVAHHRPQRSQAGRGEEQARQLAVRIERHEPVVKEALCCRSQFRLAGARSGLPGPEYQPFGNSRKRREVGVTP
jgi:hypothetical protein